MLHRQFMVFSHAIVCLVITLAQFTDSPAASPEPIDRPVAVATEFVTTDITPEVSGPDFTDPDIVELLRDHAISFGNLEDLRPMLDEISGQRLVLMGEASHGTTEYYQWRVRLSRYLIEERGFDFIAVEGDWPAFYDINRYVKHKEGAPGSALEAMDSLDRWPPWMWRNHEVLELIEWMHEHNADRPPEERAGLYGVDLYAYERSIRDVIDYIGQQDDRLGEIAREAYDCFLQFPDQRAYLQSIAGGNPDCSQELQEPLDILQEQRSRWEEQDRPSWFEAKMNARVAVQAERHIRGNLQQGPDAWNERASHFEDTASRLLDYYGEASQGIVWAHNTHIGDARATEMGQVGMVNIGQLAREEYGIGNIYAIGFGTYSGQVLAGRQWEGEKETMDVPDAQPRSWEAFLEQTGHEQFLLTFSSPRLYDELDSPLPHRAIGVTYQPQQDAQNNYVQTILPDRYNAFLFFRETGILDTLD